MVIDETDDETLQSFYDAIKVFLSKFLPSEKI